LLQPCIVTLYCSPLIKFSSNNKEGEMEKQKKEKIRVDGVEESGDSKL